MTMDYSDRNGAHVLAARIREFWRQRGFNCTTSVEPVVAAKLPAKSGQVPTWIVRSNIGPNGFPPRA